MTHSISEGRANRSRHCARLAGRSHGVTSASSQWESQRRSLVRNGIVARHLGWQHVGDDLWTMRRAFAADLLNLTLAAPRLNRYVKKAKDAAD